MSHTLQAVESLKASDTAENQIQNLRQRVEDETSRAESLEKQKKSMQETIASLAEREVHLSPLNQFIFKTFCPPCRFAEKSVQGTGESENDAQIILSEPNRGRCTTKSERISEAIRSGRRII